MKVRCLFTFLMILACPPLTAGGSPSSADDRVAFFESRIRPVLVKHCYSCHSRDAKNVRGGLLLDSAEATVDGGESGDVVVPGDPDSSLLISSLKHESFEMPPSGKLADEIIADFEKWIRDGAVDPRTGGSKVKRQEIDLKAGRQFWSFRPVQLPSVPQHSEWANTDIDRFVAQGHHSAGLTPAADASPAEVVRRLSFALTGLPPSEEEILSFEKDYRFDPDQAISQWTDRWLNSARYSERWARHWLDVTRFSESSGGGRSLLFPHAWRFRDYIVQSFHNDKSLPQLIREHLAGDLLPAETPEQQDEQITGVGYLILGPNNYEQQDKELLRMDVIDEQINTVGRTFLGMTLGCARCHDHKFDPIPATDYYAMAGIFRSTESLVFGNVSGYVTAQLNSGPEAKEHTAWKTEVDSLKKQLQAVESRLESISGAKIKTTMTASMLPGIVVDDTDAEFEGKWVDSTHIKVFVDEGYQHNDNQQDGHKVTFRARLPKSGDYEVRFAWNAGPSRCSRLPIQVKHADGTQTIVIDQRKQPDDGLFSSLGTFAFDANVPAEVVVAAERPASGYVIVDAVQFVPASSSKDPQFAEADQRLKTNLTADAKALRDELRKVESRNVPEPRVMSVRDRKDPADWHLHVRGEVRHLGELVPRGVLSVAAELDSKGRPRPLRIPSGQSGRLQLADWIASERNPLTARVYVNRVWQHLLGEGIVRTPDNFGVTGERPTHPELLDYLAHTFIHEDNWSTKRLIRRITASRVFRLSVIHSVATKQDPDNQFLARGFRRQLDAEALRDAMLTVSRQLDLSVTGGRTIKKITTYDNDYQHSKYPTQVRSLFVPFFRNAPLPFLATFNGVNSNMVSGRRSESTLPSQALFLMNSEFVIEQSNAAAKHFQKMYPDDFSGLLNSVFLNTIGRRPQQAERELMESWLQSADNHEEALAGLFQSLFSSIDFRYVN